MTRRGGRSGGGSAGPGARPERFACLGESRFWMSSATQLEFMEASLGWRPAWQNCRRSRGLGHGSALPRQPDDEDFHLPDLRMDAHGGGPGSGCTESIHGLRRGIGSSHRQGPGINPPRMKSGTRWRNSAARTGGTPASGRRRSAGRSAEPEYITMKSPC